MIFAGIDEAGYGPRLGPLVVAATAFRAGGGAPSAEGGPWQPVHGGAASREVGGRDQARGCGAGSDETGEAAARSRDGAGGGFDVLPPGILPGISDSKRAYSRRKGLGGLERAVLGACRACGACASNLEEFLERCCVDGGGEALSRPWYSFEELGLPRVLGEDELRRGAEEFAAALLAAEGLGRGLSSAESAEAPGSGPSSGPASRAASRGADAVDRKAGATGEVDRPGAAAVRAGSPGGEDTFGAVEARAGGAAANEGGGGKRETAGGRAAGGLEYLGASLCVVGATRYNEIVARVGNKATLLFGRASILMRDLWEKHGREGVSLTVDRHGGRKYYAGLLDIAFPEAKIEVLSESEEESCYRLSGGGRGMGLRFAARAEERDASVALASMFSKYTRELFMELFNRYWLARAGQVAATAGYWEDGERFLAEIVSSGAVTRPEAERFTRMV